MRNITCTACSKSMGTIRDASLRKGLKFICGGCDSMRLHIASEASKLNEENRRQSAQAQQATSGLWDGFGNN